MSDSDDDGFNFQSTENFDQVQEEKETMISNDQHYVILKEISDNFFKSLETHDDFNHKSSWRSFSNLEPIKINISTQENLPGICDLIKTKNNFLNKVVIALSSIIYEIENILPNNGYSPYECLYPLSFYGETVGDNEDDIKNLTSGKREEQISKMLSYFNEIMDKITKLLSIAINLFNQLINIYSTQNKNLKTFKNVYLDICFSYLGKILGFFLTIDTILEQNENLHKDWEAYRLMVHNCSKNLSQFNMNEDQKKKLEKLIKKLNAAIFDKTCYKQCVRMLIQKTGVIIPSGNGFSPTVNNKIFIEMFTNYLKWKCAKLYSEVDTFTESQERFELFNFLALFGVYYTLMELNKIDQNLLKDVWKFQKKIWDINIIGNIHFNIQNFLKNFNLYKKITLEPKNVLKHNFQYFDDTTKNFPKLINNLRNLVMAWLTKIESDIFESKMLLEKNIVINAEKIVEKTNNRIKLILNGLSTSNLIKRKIQYILNVAFIYQKNLSTEIINYITTGLELIKVIKSEFDRILPYIAINLNVMNRAILANIQSILTKIHDKLSPQINKKSNIDVSIKDQLNASVIFYTVTQGTPSLLRRVIYKICYSIIKNLLSEKETNMIQFFFWKLETLNELTKEINFSTDCSFLFWYQTILSTSLNQIFNDSPKRLYFFSMAVNDIEKPLYHIKYLDNNGMELIKNQRKIILDLFEKEFLKKLAQEIEIDLRKQVHSIFIKGLNTPEPSTKNLANYLTIKHFQLFDKIISIKRYVEEYLNLTFYKMTTLNLNDWHTYQLMRVLSENKYNLNLHEIFLPSQNLEQGKDILTIIRNLSIFAKNYTHNLHNQTFIQIAKESSYVNVIGVPQILNSLYTHGTGIINSVINKSYQFLSKLIPKILLLIDDDYIKSTLKDEENFWNENKTKINYFYPFERAEEVRKRIQSISQNYKSGISEQVIKIITQIGNAVGLARVIRSALMEYNSTNIQLLTDEKFNEFKKMTQQISLEIQIDENNNNNNSNISQNMLNNSQNSFNDSNKMFCETISALQQTGENNINYLSILVTNFGDLLSYEKIPDVSLFSFLFPALTITFVEKNIVAKENLLKKNKNDEEAFFSDDGFIMGLCYLLKVYHIDKLFESLNWFNSVIEKYKNEKKEYEDRKNNMKKKDDNVKFNISEKRINTFLEQFEMFYFTYSSATVLFNE